MYIKNKVPRGTIDNSFYYTWFKEIIISNKKSPAEISTGALCFT